MGAVELAACLHDGTLQVVVRDEGAGFRPGSPKVQGTGMMLIGECADDLTVDEGPGGVTVTMTFVLRR